ncbi:MAG: rhodanese-like domain-containing protein, partial [Planctomycetota bacterium]
NTSLSLKEFQQELDAGAVVVDLRDQSAFGGAHVPNSFGIGANGNVSGWASWVVPYDTPIVLICEAHEQEFAIRSLIRVGLDDIRGRLDGGFTAWREAGLAVQSFPQWTPREGHHRLDEGTISIVDVRSADEYRAGHAPGARWCYLGDLENAAKRGEFGSEVGVICRTGYRSTVAASVLERNGVPSVFNLTGGMRAWGNAGLPVVSETGEEPPSAF